MEINRPPLHSACVDGSRWRWWHTVIFFPQRSTLFAHRLWRLSIHFFIPFWNWYVIDRSGQNGKHDNCSNCVRRWATTLLGETLAQPAFTSVRGFRGFRAATSERSVVRGKNSTFFWMRTLFTGFCSVHWGRECSEVLCLATHIAAPLNHDTDYIHNVKPGLPFLGQSPI